MTIKTTMIVRAIAFFETSEAKVFDAVAENLDAIPDAAQEVLAAAKQYEAENAGAALINQIEKANGKKLTKAQRELVMLTLAIQSGEHQSDEPEAEDEPAPMEKTTVQPEPETVETTTETVTEEPAAEEPTEEPEPEAEPEPTAEEVTKEAAAEVSNPTSDSAVDDALAALGL